MKPLIKTMPPGPKARAILKRDEKVIANCLTREYPLVAEKAYGSNIEDVDGNRYLDFGSGIAVMGIGHSHPEVRKAVLNQLEKLSHIGFADFYSEIPVKFAEKLVSFMPKNMDQVFFTNSGAETIESAMKIARHSTKRPYFLSFYGSFHGRTMGALTLTAAKVVQKEGYGPFLPSIHVPYPNPYRSKNPDRCADETLEYLEHQIFRKDVPPTEVSSVFVEPIAGEGGYIVPPKDFIPKLRKLCSDYGILLVSDEIQAGCFRTGKFMAMENFKVQPDIACFSKAIGGGYPAGAMITNEKLVEWQGCSGAYAGTFGGNLVASAAGSAVLDYFKRVKIWKKVEKDGKYIMRFLKDLQPKCKNVGDVRGIGMMIGIELVKDKKSKTHAAVLASKLVNRCFGRGLILIPAGISTVRVIPPLTIEREDLNTGLKILADELKKLK